MTTYHQLIPEGTMQKRPVLVLLNGFAAVVSLVLIALNICGVTHLDAAQTTAVVAAVAGGCNLAALTIQASVYSPETYEADVAKALATPAPSQRVTYGNSGAVQIIPPTGNVTVQNPKDGR